MRAKVGTHGGEPVSPGSHFRTVQHWQLYVDGRFIADSSLAVDRKIYEAIVEIIERDTQRNEPA